MQIFWLHKEPRKNAKLYSDTHCSKIILEIGQIVSTALRINGIDDDRLYKKTHKNHPCVRWAKESSLNVRKALRLMYQLNEEKKRRFESGDHATYKKLVKELNIGELISRAEFEKPERVGSVPPQAFKDCPKALTDGQTWDQVVEGYRRYYQLEKSDISEWNHSETPEFMKEYIV